jgi:hypothetical protein
LPRPVEKLVHCAVVSPIKIVAKTNKAIVNIFIAILLYRFVLFFEKIDTLRTMKNAKKRGVRII